MIAPIRHTDPPTQESHSARRLARLLVAWALFRDPETRQQRLPPLAAWKAWLIVAWLTLTAVVYATHMAELW